MPGLISLDLRISTLPARGGCCPSAKAENDVKAAKTVKAGTARKSMFGWGSVASSVSRRAGHNDSGGYAAFSMWKRPKPRVHQMPVLRRASLDRGSNPRRGATELPLISLQLCL